MSHLTFEQKYTIEILLCKNYSTREISSILHKDRSVIYREVRRNRDRDKVYKADLAHRKYLLRHKQKPKLKRFTYEIKATVNRL